MNTLLIVDDEPAALRLYTTFLGDTYDVITAESGEAALALLDESVDLVLLDRLMPGLSGDEVLAEIRKHYDCPVAMVTAVEPELSTVTLAFDDYLVKPVTEERLNELVESLLARVEYGDAVREYFEVLSKVALLDEHASTSTVEGSREYADLLQRLAAVKEEARSTLDDAIVEGSFETLLRSLDSE